MISLPQPNGSNGVGGRNCEASNSTSHHHDQTSTFLSTTEDSGIGTSLRSFTDSPMTCLVLPSRALNVVQPAMCPPGSNTYITCSNTNHTPSTSTSNSYCVSTGLEHSPVIYRNSAPVSGTPHRVQSSPRTLTLSNPQGAEDVRFSGAIFDFHESPGLLELGSPESAVFRRRATSGSENAHDATPSKRARYAQNDAVYEPNSSRTLMMDASICDANPTNQRLPISSSTPIVKVTGPTQAPIQMTSPELNLTGTGGSLLGLDGLPRTPTPFKKAMAAVQRRRGRIEPISLLNDSTPHQLVDDIREMHRQERTHMTSSHTTMTSPKANYNHVSVPDFSLTPSKLYVDSNMEQREQLMSCFNHSFDVPATLANQRQASTVLPISAIVKQEEGAEHTDSTSLFQPPAHEPEIMSAGWLQIVCGHTSSQQSMTSLAKLFLANRNRT